MRGEFMAVCSVAGAGGSQIDGTALHDYVARSFEAGDSSRLRWAAPRRNAAKVSRRVFAFHGVASKHDHNDPN
jgi:hypothetical protein